MEDYTMCGKIGGGAQGVVYRVKHNQTNKYLAMKVIRCADQSKVNAALKEIKVLLRLRHQHVVSYVDFFLVFHNDQVRHEFAMAHKTEGQLTEAGQQFRMYNATGLSDMDLEGKETLPCQSVFSVRHPEVCVCLVMELCTCGDMQGTIRSARQHFMEHGSHPIPEAQMLSWIEQCASTLAFIHGQNFFHRDLKPTNIFFDKYKDIKIGDFGLAASVDLGRQSIVGTPLYLAPERMLHQTYDEKVDVWSLGVVMLELVTLREQPINSRLLENPLVVESVVQQVTELGFSTKLGELLRDILQRFPEERPSPAEILRRVSDMTSHSPQPNLSSHSLPLGVSHPKLSSVVCVLCEVEQATVICSPCGATYCEECDRTRHKHHSRQSHDRTSLSVPRVGQVTRALALNDITNSSANILPNMKCVKKDDNTSSRPFSRAKFPSFLDGCPTSLTSATETSSNAILNSVSNTIIKVPQDYPTLSDALSAAIRLPHLRKIVVASNTIHNSAIILTDRIPDNIRIIGENPPPVIEVDDTLIAVSCASGRGSIENFIIRHAGRYVSFIDSKPGEKPLRKAPRPIAISITGGEWKITNCRISCSGGSGISIGAHVEAIVSHCMIIEVKTAGVVVLEGGRGLIEKNTFTNCGYAGLLMRKNSSPRVKCNYVHDGVETGIFCQDSSGLIEDNDIVSNGGCGIVAKGSDVSTIFQGNRINLNGQAGFFCCDGAAPIITGNEIRQNGRAGILIKTRASPKITKNVIRNGKEAGIYVFENGSGLIEENEILRNNNAGILVTSCGSPSVIKNTIFGNLYEGVWVCKNGGGTFLQNDVRGNSKGSKDVEKGCSIVWIDNCEA